MKKHTLRLLSIGMIIAILLGALTACGGGKVSGKYYDEDGNYMDFKSGGKVVFGGPDMPAEFSSFELDYKVNGDKVVISMTLFGMTEEIQTLTIIDSKTLQDEDGEIIRKK